MAGLLNQAYSSSTASGYDPTLRYIDPTTETVEGRIGALTASDSPFMQQARTQAKEAANARGLINSSMAVGAGENAAYSAALPIANADATAYQTAARDNQGVSNAASQFNAGSQNQFGLQTLQGGQQSELLTQKAGIDQALLTAEGAQRSDLLFQQGAIEEQLQTLKGTQAGTLSKQEFTQASSLQGLRGEQAQGLAEIEASYKTLMQTNDSAGKLYQQTVDSINKVLIDPNLDAANKQSAVDKMQLMLKSGLSVIGKVSAIPDLQNILTFA